MALDRRKSGGLILIGLLLLAVLAWAWIDSGERPLSRLEAPAVLPKVGP